MVAVEAIPGLFSAIAQGNEAKVIQILNKGGDINAACPPQFFTPLTAATLTGNLRLVEVIAGREANLDAKDSEGRPALFFALHNKEYDIARFLLSKGASATAFADKAKQVCLLEWAAKEAPFEVVQMLVEHGAIINRKNREKGALLIAVFNGRYDVVKYLLDHGADIELPCYQGMNALMGSTYQTNLDVIRLLLERGANPNARNSVGTTALVYSMEFENVWAMEILLDHGADINCQNDQEDTPLHHAIEAGKFLSASYLLYRGANPNIKGFKGKTALVSALFVQNNKMINLLLSYGADTTIVAGRNTSILEFAMLDQNDHAFDILLRHGAPLNCLTNDVNSNPLTKAIYMKNNVIVDAFLSNGLDPNFVVLEVNLLTLAASKGALEIAQNLINRGADVNRFLPRGPTALTFAVQRGDIEMVKLLLKHGADPHRVGPDGTSILSVCKDPKIRALIQK